MRTMSQRKELESAQVTRCSPLASVHVCVHAGTQHTHIKNKNKSFLKNSQEEGDPKPVALLILY